MVHLGEKLFISRPGTRHRTDIESSFSYVPSASGVVDITFLPQARCRILTLGTLHSSVLF